jgi:3-oxoadipate enol-lactonase
MLRIVSLKRHDGMVRPHRPSRRRATEVVEPPLPPAELLSLDGRGELLVRVWDGPDDRRSARRLPPLVLIHGWTVTADVNWFALYDQLSQRHAFAAFDQRGHGRGLRPPLFTLEDCADDVVAVADALGWGQIVPVGYSMGGTIAQLVAHRHPQRCAGLILCSTAAVFAETRQDHLFFDGVLGTTVRALSTLPKFLQDRMPGRIRAVGPDESNHREWMEQETKRHDAVRVAEAGQAIGRFNSESWLRELTLPTAVVVTSSDTVVPPTRQRQLAAMLPNATVHTVELDHSASTSDPETYWPVLDAALASVAKRQPGFVSRRAKATRRSVQHLFVSGRVQDVGFRQSMQRRAQELGVSGWVRNRRDGRVEALVVGTRAKVDELLAWARQGPPMAKVTDVRTARNDLKAAATDGSFEILPTE